MISFREVQPQDAEMILQWRTNPRVAAQMNTEVKADLEPHRKWLMGCYERPNYYHWLIESQRTAVGLISLSGLNTAVGYTSWGFYIGDDHALGLGAFVPPYFYNFAFETFGLAEVRAEVLTTNETVVRLHQLHGYVRHPERDQTIIKGITCHGAGGRHLAARQIHTYAGGFSNQLVAGCTRLRRQSDLALLGAPFAPATFIER
jgi:UDP-4-amino-4,6-dideoxy-N-acetyl-beta-L-altrosamine N-acetyltransferase